MPVRRAKTAVPDPPHDERPRPAVPPYDLDDLDAFGQLIRGTYPVITDTSCLRMLSDDATGPPWARCSFSRPPEAACHLPTHRASPLRLPNADGERFDVGAQVGVEFAQFGGSHPPFRSRQQAGSRRALNRGALAQGAGIKRPGVTQVERERHPPDEIVCQTGTSA